MYNLEQTHLQWVPLFLFSSRLVNVDLRDPKIGYPEILFDCRVCLLQMTALAFVSIETPGLLRTTEHDHILLWQSLPTSHAIQHGRPDILLAAIFAGRPASRAARVLRPNRHTRPDSNHFVDNQTISGGVGKLY